MWRAYQTFSGYLIFWNSSVKSLPCLPVHCLPQTVLKSQLSSAAGYSSIPVLPPAPPSRPTPILDTIRQCSKLSEPLLAVATKQLVFTACLTLVELLQVIELGTWVMGAAPGKDTMDSCCSVIFMYTFLCCIPLIDFSEWWRGCFWQFCLAL